VAVLTGKALVLPVLCSLPSSHQSTTANLSTTPRLAVAEDRIRKKHGSMLTVLFSCCPHVDFTAGTFLCRFYREAYIRVSAEGQSLADKVTVV
jgi:hypothetical protein